MIPIKFLNPKYLPTWLLLLTMWLASKLPFTVQFFLGKIFGNLVYFVAQKRRKIASKNIELCFPNKTPAAVKQLTQQHFIELGISLFEIANCFFASSNKLKSQYQLINSEILQNALNAKQNIILLIGHFTTMLIAGRILLLNFKFADVYRPQNNVLFDYIMCRRFTNFGSTMINAKNPKTMLKVLKSGLPLWYAHDQDLGAKVSVLADFFNIPTATITATARFANIKNTVVIPLTYYRHQQQYILQFEPPLGQLAENNQSNPTIDYPSDDALQNANLSNKILEQQILKKPEQYGWIHKRFKTRPNNSPSFYD